jgi:hypothetical protein
MDKKRYVRVHQPNNIIHIVEIRDLFSLLEKLDEYIVTTSRGEMIMRKPWKKKANTSG